MKSVVVPVKPNKENIGFILYNFIYSQSRNYLTNTSKYWLFDLQELQSELKKSNICYDDDDVQKELNDMLKDGKLIHQFTGGHKYQFIG